MLRLWSSVALLIGILGIFVAGNETVPECPDIVSRTEWRARPPKAITYMPYPVENAVIIHTATLTQCTTLEQCSKRMRNIQQNHLAERNFNDIAFSFLIGGDGHIYEGVGWHKAGSHTRGYNSNSLGIAFHGNFEDAVPSDNMLTALRKLLACAVQKGELKADYKLFAQRQLIATISPGKTFFEALQKWPHWTVSP